MSSKFILRYCRADLFPHSYWEVFYEENRYVGRMKYDGQYFTVIYSVSPYKNLKAKNLTLYEELIPEFEKSKIFYLETGCAMILAEIVRGEDPLYVEIKC